MRSDGHAGGETQFHELLVEFLYLPAKDIIPDDKGRAIPSFIGEEKERVGWVGKLGVLSPLKQRCSFNSHIPMMILRFRHWVFSAPLFFVSFIPKD